MFTQLIWDHFYFSNILGLWGKPQWNNRKHVSSCTDLGHLQSSKNHCLLEHDPFSCVAVEGPHPFPLLLLILSSSGIFHVLQCPVQSSRVATALIFTHWVLWGKYDLHHPPSLKKGIVIQFISELRNKILILTHKTQQHIETNDLL